MENTDELFYTDSNSLAFMKRETDVYFKRYNQTTKQRISSNYYPVTSGIWIEDLSKEKQFIVMPSNCEGGTAANNGTIELMMNRRMLFQDDLGNDEVLNEQHMVNGNKVGVRTFTSYTLALTDSR